MKIAAIAPAVIALAALPVCAAAGGTLKPNVSGFATGGHTVYHLRPATVEPNGGRCIISAAYDGSVS